MSKLAYSTTGSDAPAELMIGVHDESDALVQDVRFFYLGITGLGIAISFGVLFPTSGAAVGFLGTVGVAGVASLLHDFRRRSRIRTRRRWIDSAERQAVRNPPSPSSDGTPPHVPL